MPKHYPSVDRSNCSSVSLSRRPLRAAACRGQKCRFEARATLRAPTCPGSARCAGKQCCFQANAIAPEPTARLSHPRDSDSAPAALQGACQRRLGAAVIGRFRWCRRTGRAHGNEKVAHAQLLSRDTVPGRGSTGAKGPALRPSGSQQGCRRPEWLRLRADGDESVNSRRPALAAPPPQVVIHAGPLVVSLARLPGRGEPRGPRRRGYARPHGPPEPSAGSNEHWTSHDPCPSNRRGVDRSRRSHRNPRSAPQALGGRPGGRPPDCI